MYVERNTAGIKEVHMNRHNTRRMYPVRMLCSANLPASDGRGRRDLMG